MTYQVIVSDSGMDVATFAADTLTEACESAATWFEGEAVSFRPGTILYPSDCPDPSDPSCTCPVCHVALLAEIPWRF